MPIDDPAAMANFEIRMKVFDAMSTLVSDTPFDKLTISSICASAGISRPTFYRYFSDKYSVVQWHMDYTHSAGVTEIGRTLSWHEGYYVTTSLIARVATLYRADAQTSDYNSVPSYAKRMRRETLVETVMNYKHADLTEKLLFEIDALVAAEVEIMPKWLYNGLEGRADSDIEKISEWMCDVVPRELFELLDTPVKPYASFHDNSFKDLARFIKPAQ